MKKRRLFKAFLSTFIIFNLFSTSAMADTGYNVANQFYLKCAIQVTGLPKLLNQTKSLWTAMVLKILIKA